MVSKTDKNVCRIENNVSLVYTLCYWLCKVKSFTIIIWYTWNQHRCQKRRMKQRILFSCTFYVDIGKITKESMSEGKSSYYIWFIMLQSFLIVNIFESFNTSYSFLERNSVDLYLWCKLFLSLRRTTHTRAHASALWWTRCLSNTNLSTAGRRIKVGLRDFFFFKGKGEKIAHINSKSDITRHRRKLREATWHVLFTKTSEAWHQWEYQETDGSCYFIMFDRFSEAYTFLSSFLA